MKLSEKYRPKEFNQVIGQDHLVGENGVFTVMLKNNKLLSSIITGPSGTGKTTIANIICEKSNLPYYFFNGSNQNKKDLSDILDKNKNGKILLVIDEFHRLNKNIQDYLLEYLENDNIIIIALTSENPYFSINPTIRSRMLLYKTNELSNQNLKTIYINILNKIDKDITIDDHLINYLINISNNEARTFLNYLDIILLYLQNDKKITLDIIKQATGNLQLNLSKTDDTFLYLSALQKSIRGSDVDASLYYLAKLINLGDIKVIARRLLTISYEDIGLASSKMHIKTYDAIKSALILGLPEARIPLSYITIELAISPKSNSAYLAIDKALKYENSYKVPDYVDNQLIKIGKANYIYPHDLNDALIDVNYLPEAIQNDIIYKPKNTSKYEILLNDRLKLLDKLRNKKRGI